MRSNTNLMTLYEAFRDRDLRRLEASLAPDVVGHVCRGMPGGVGGDHHGARAMLRDVWLEVFASYDVAPVPESVVWTIEGDAVVQGYYRGSHRATGRRVDAEFVHLLRFDDDGRVCELRQVTDTASWTVGP